MTKGIDKAKPWAKRLSRIVHARLTFLTETPFVQLVALICIALCITIYPLGFIPFAVAAPGAGLLFFGIGLTARDGVVILLGMSFVGLTIWLLIELWPKIQAGWNALFG